jgi:tRNA A-37 threonylcarbamoyl transferase component Bud32
MEDSTPCPSDQELADYAANRLDSSAANEIKAHVVSCPVCKQALARLEDAQSQTDERESSLTTSLRPATTDTDEPDTIDRLDERIFNFGVLEPAASPDALGKIGSYDILEVIGHGGMGVVFKARDRQLDRTVAIKVLARDLASSDTARRRFRREARAAAAINHPNVVTIHAVDEHRELTFLVMEYVKGKSLRDRIRFEGRLKPVEVIQLSAQIAAGLAAAHAQGVVHRDIKPGNVMLEDRLSRVKITDFGLARIAVDNVELTSRNVAVGTPAYMAPEQLSGNDVDSRADLFSLGCVMYAMLTGHSPFHGRHSIEVTHKVVGHNPPPLHESDPGVPRFLSEIIARLLKKDPTTRFQSAAELAELLNQHLTVLNQTPSDKISTVLRGLTNAPAHPPRTHAWAYGIGAVGVILAALLAWRPWEQPQPKQEGGALPSAPPAIASKNWITGEITVAKTGEAKFQSLVEAVRHAGPGAKIQVLDSADYEGAIVIDGREQWAGLSIEAVKGACLKAQTASTVIRIENTPNVALRGFRMELNAQQHGVQISGPCEGLTLERIQVIQPRESPKALIHLRDGARGSQQSPIILRNLALTCGEIGVGMMGLGGPYIGHVRLEDSHFTGDNQTPGKGVFVILNGPVRDVIVSGNVFRKTRAGVSIKAPAPKQLDKVTIANNTFTDVTFWMNLNDTSLEQDQVSIESNLILDSSSVRLVPPLTEAGLSTVAAGWFDHNWWEQRPSTNETLWQAVAQFTGDPDIHRDPQQPHYLHPRPQSPLVMSTGQAGGRSIIGALEPADVETDRP